MGLKGLNHETSLKKGVLIGELNLHVELVDSLISESDSNDIP